MKNLDVLALKLKWRKIENRIIIYLKMENPDELILPSSFQENSIRFDC